MWCSAYGRTSEGEKITTLEHNRWVAFEVDEVEDIFNWRSVVVHGSFWKLHPQGSPHAEELWTHAADLVSRIVPGALTDRDPVAFRHALFRIAVGDASGREARTKPVEKSGPVPASFRAVSGGERQSESDPCPRVNATLDPDAAAVRFDDALGDGQPEPPPVAFGTVGLPVSLEYARKIFGRDTCASV